MNIEVEIRAKVNDFGIIKQKFKEIGIDFIKSERQMDKIFGAKKFLDSEHKIVEGGIVARIREIDDKRNLEFKEISREKGGIELNCEVSSVEMAEKMLEKLDFEEAFTIKKIREVYSYSAGDEALPHLHLRPALRDSVFEVCLDEVEQLGNFIEIEKMVGVKEKINSAREECLNLLKQISPDAEITNEKYGDMMQNIINKNR